MNNAKKDFVNFIENNSFSVLICSLIFAGVLAGVYYYHAFGEGDPSKILFASGFLKVRVGMTGFSVFLDTFLNNMFYLVALFLLGYWALAQPIQFVIPVYKGITLGATVAQIYTGAGIKGFAVVLILIIPSMIVTIIMLIVATRESIRLSNLIAVRAFKQSFTAGLMENVRLYIRKFILLSIFAAVSGAVDGITFELFGKYLL